MADPKTNGPDPAQLLRAAEEALEAAEKVWPPPVPQGLYDAAASAVSKAAPHLQAHTAGRLGDRMNLLTRAEPGAVKAPVPDSGEKTVTEYRLVDAKGNYGLPGERPVLSHELKRLDRKHPNFAPHRQQSRQVTEWEDVPDA